MVTRAVFLLGVSTLPGLICGLSLLPHYHFNPTSSRYVFLCVDRRQERNLARRLRDTWGEKLTRRYRVLSTGEIVDKIQSAYSEIRAKYQYKLQGKTVVFDSDELILHLLPTGDLYISSGSIQGLDLDQVKWLLAHQLGHMHFQHAQEHLGYAHITAMAVGWLQRNNHHTTDRLGNYLVKNRRWSEQQEIEAEEFAKGLISEPKTGKPICIRGVNTT